MENTTNERSLSELFMETSRKYRRYHELQHDPRRMAFDPRNGQGRILKLLQKTETISQKDMAFLLGIRPQSLGELLRKLESSGHVVRTPSETDKRVMMVSLTEQGKNVQLDLHNDEAVFSCLNEEEQQQLKTCCEHLLERLEELGVQPEEQPGPRGPRPCPHPHPHGAGFGPGQPDFASRPEGFEHDGCPHNGFVPHQAGPGDFGPHGFDPHKPDPRSFGPYGFAPHGPAHCGFGPRGFDSPSCHEPEHQQQRPEQTEEEPSPRKANEQPEFGFGSMPHPRSEEFDPSAFAWKKPFGKFHDFQNASFEDEQIREYFEGFGPVDPDHPLKDIRPDFMSADTCDERNDEAKEDQDPSRGNDQGESVPSKD